LPRLSRVDRRSATTVPTGSWEGDSVVVSRCGTAGAAVVGAGGPVCVTSKKTWSVCAQGVQTRECHYGLQGRSRGHKSNTFCKRSEYCVRRSTSAGEWLLTVIGCDTSGSNGVISCWSSETTARSSCNCASTCNCAVWVCWAVVALTLCTVFACSSVSCEIRISEFLLRSINCCCRSLF